MTEQSPYLVTNYDAYKKKFPFLEPKSEPPFQCIWSIEKMDVIPEKNGLTNLIHIVHIEVRRSPTSEPYKLPVQVGTENISVENFIEFDQLQESQVIEWVKEVLTKLRQDFVWDIEWATPASSDTIVKTF